MGMGGICHIGELMELSKLENRKKQKREWYERNCEKVLEQQKNSENKKDNQKDWLKGLIKKSIPAFSSKSNGSLFLSPKGTVVIRAFGIK